MDPIRKKKNGRELGNAAAAAELSGVTWETYQWYVRTGRPAGNPPPGHVEIDNETGQRMYPLKEVRAWNEKRPGRGNWGGLGARARRAAEAPSTPEELAGPRHYLNRPAEGGEQVLSADQSQTFATVADLVAEQTEVDQVEVPTEVAEAKVEQEIEAAEKMPDGDV